MKNDSPQNASKYRKLRSKLRNKSPLKKVEPLFEMIRDWKEFLSYAVSGDEIEKLRHHDKTGRPAGSGDFIRKLEITLGCILER